MKLTLCTLAVCLSLLATALTLKEAIQAEGKRTRAAIPKALVEPLAGKEPDSVAQKLDAVQAQLVSVGRRLSLLEEASGRSPKPLPADTASDPVRDEIRSLSDNMRDLAAGQARLSGVPEHLARLTTFLDQSFGHLEKRMTEKNTPDELLVSVDWLVQQVDDINHYFTPLFAFLGVVYNPAGQDVIDAYPSVDARLNELAAELAALRTAAADIRQNLSVPIVIEPTRRP